MALIKAELPEWAEGLAAPHRFKAIYGGRGSGKALDADTPVPTPNGWTRMGDLRVGDEVYDEAGHPSRVTGVFPQGKRPAFAVRFSDGAELIADADHLWVTTDHPFRKASQRKGEREFIWNTWTWTPPVTTAEIARTLTYGKRGDLNHAIELNRPLRGDHVDLPVSPYALGLWLGDGTTSESRLTAHEDDLQWAGVMMNKHIPTVYLRASVEQRLALLRGLMDTDGYVDENGTCEFTNTKRDLAEGVLELVRTLGIRASIGEGRATQGGRDYRVCFTPHVQVFSLPRSVSPKPLYKGQSRRRMIRSVDDLGEDREMVCISVDSPHSLYLAGREMIPTHNSWSVSGMLILMGTQRPLRIACVREVQSSITESSKRALESWIKRLGLGNFYRVQKYTINGSNGTYFFFQGLSGATEESIKSWEDIDMVWFEEAQRMSMRSREILYPTIRKPGSELWFTFNPRYRSDPVYQDFVLGGIKDAFVQHVNYDMNPWFPDELEQERQRCLEMEPGRYSHIWLGDLDDAGEERHVLPFGLLEKCVGAHEKVGYKPSGRIHAGLDVADTGVDNNALVLRRGPLIQAVHTWSALTLGETARRAHGICSERGVSRLYYDASGIGGGVRSHLHEIGNKPYYADPVLFGGAVLGPKREYSYRVHNNDFFARRNAQLGWALRLRAQRTEQLLKGENIDPERCLFIDSGIPGLEMYLSEMTQPLWKENSSGKMEIDKMGRNEKSPDRYDATALAFAWDSRAGLRAHRGGAQTEEREAD